MTEIGGYFGLELSKGNHLYHGETMALKSGRSSLHLIFTHIKPSLVYIPYYTCDALLEPFQVHGTKFTFYEVNESLEPKFLPELNAGEFFLYVNYFDLKREYVRMLSDKYVGKLIVDCTQAFFMKGNGRSWYFNSCRKYFGVPDGSYLYPPIDAQVPGCTLQNETFTTDHLIKRFNGHVREGYDSFLKNEVLCDSDISGMSRLSEHMLSHVDYAGIEARRRANYLYLHECFKDTNLFIVCSVNECVPMVYPLLLKKEIDRSLLSSSGIFIPTLWRDVLNRSELGFELEKSLTSRLFPLPIDHRYGLGEMERMVNVIRSIS